MNISKVFQGRHSFRFGNSVLQQQCYFDTSKKVLLKLIIYSIKNIFSTLLNKLIIITIKFGNTAPTIYSGEEIYFQWDKWSKPSLICITYFLRIVYTESSRITWSFNIFEEHIWLNVYNNKKIFTNPWIDLLFSYSTRKGLHKFCRDFKCFTATLHCRSKNGN